MDAEETAAGRIDQQIKNMVITTKQFQLLTDIDLVWDYLVDIYDRENGSGMPAPFFEHAKF